LASPQILWDGIVPQAEGNLARLFAAMVYWKDMSEEQSVAMTVIT
jgi:hypothetical protein